MSVKVSHLVWEYADLKGSPLIVLLAMADFADDDGSNVYPSRERLAKKARIDVRSVSRILTDLENAKLISVTEMETGQRGRYRNYTIVLENLIPAEFLGAFREMGDRKRNETGRQIVPRSKTEGHPAPNRETNSTRPGDICVSRIDNHPRPVLNPPLARDAASPEGVDAARRKWATVVTALRGKQSLLKLIARRVFFEGKTLTVEFTNDLALGAARPLEEEARALLDCPLAFVAAAKVLA